MPKGRNLARKPGSGRPAAAMAVLLPFLFAGLTAPLSALFPVDGPQNLEDVIDDCEDWGLLLLAGALAAMVLCAVLGRFVARGRTRLVPWLLGAALLPWICGIIGTELTLREVLPDLEHSTSEAAIAIAKLLAVAGATNYLGMVLTASLLLSCGLVLAMAADRYRPIAPGAGARLLHALLALPLFGLAALCLEMREPLMGFPLAPAALMVLIGLLLAARASANATDRRGFGLDLAAVLALGLGFFVTAEMVRWGVAREAYEALESAAPESRSYVIERALMSTIPADTATRGTWLVLGLMLLTAARGAERAHHFAGAAGKLIAVAVAMCVFTFALAEQHRSRETGLMRAAAVPPWTEIAGFQPVAAEDDRCCAGLGIYHAAIGLDRAWTWDGAERAIPRMETEAGRRALARLFVGLLAAGDPPPPRPPAPFDRARYWQRREPAAKRSWHEELLPAEPSLNLVLDARLTPGQLASVLDAAGRAGARSVELTTLRGARGNHRHIPGLPASYGDFPFACSDRVYLANAIGLELYARDPNLAHTRLDDPSWVRVELLREHDPDNFGFSLEGRFDPDDYPELLGPVHPLYVRFGHATTPGALAQLSSRACQLGYDVALTFGQPAALSAALRVRQQQNQ